MRKSKKSPKEKQKTSKTEPPPKKDPVQYVSETGDGTMVYHHIADIHARAGQHDLKPMLLLFVTFTLMMIKQYIYLLNICI